MQALSQLSYTPVPVKKQDYRLGSCIMQTLVGFI
jgi:hypothetical protein